MMSSRRKPGKKTLAFVERAYRGPLEEQYGHILWLSRVIRAMGGDTRVVLLGEAVMMARKGTHPQTLRLGDVEIAAVSHPAATLAALVRDGVRIYAGAEACLALGLGAHDLIPEVELADTARQAALCGEVDVLWYW